MKIEDFKDYIGFGIAGNFAHHLDQAGEAKDFIGVEVEEENAPKGLFPFYQPVLNGTFLNTFPLSNDKINLPDIKGSKVQVEPEVALICELEYDEDNKVSNIEVKSFCAYNDCSVREPNAPKISQKKNWGENTKGTSLQTIAIDKFEEGGTMDDFYIASFLKCDGEVKAYGKDSAVITYNYFYDKLVQWMIGKLNTQEDFGPLENLSEVLKEANYPKNMIVSIGATAYTDFGEHRFLQEEDEVFVCIYDKTKYSLEELEEHIKNGNTNLEGASILHQDILNPQGLFLKGEDTKRIYKKYLAYEEENLFMCNRSYEDKLELIFGNKEYKTQIQEYIKQLRKGKNKIICDFEIEGINMKEDDIEEVVSAIESNYDQEEFCKHIIIKCLKNYQKDVQEYKDFDFEYDSDND